MTLGTMFQTVKMRGRWQKRMKAVNLATHFSKKVFYQQPKFEFLIGLVHTKNHTYKFFSKSINLSNWQGIA